jgi:hypothetical protein
MGICFYGDTYQVHVHAPGRYLNVYMRSNALLTLLKGSVLCLLRRDSDNGESEAETRQDVLHFLPHNLSKEAMT